MADLIGVESELASRVLWVQRKADTLRRGRAFWITTGWRSMPEQWRLWSDWVAALRKVGWKGDPRQAPRDVRRKAQKFAPLAAYPGTSNHGSAPAKAVDLACDEIDNGLRAALIKEAGLHTPIDGEPWHVELAPNRGLLPTTTTPKPTPILQPSEEEDMSDFVDQIVWPNGSKTRVFANGDVQCVGRPAPPHFGGVGSFPEKDRLAFTKASGITPVDINDWEKGYTIWNEKDAEGQNDPYDFNRDVLNKLLGR